MSAQTWFPLSEAQVKERAEQLVDTLNAIDDLDEAKSQAMKDFRDERVGLLRRVRELKSAVRNKGEYRDAQQGLFESAESVAKKGAAKLVKGLREAGVTSIEFRSEDLGKVKKAAKTLGKQKPGEADAP